jgi:peptide-methionine (R)-S-oxide reductase
MTTRRTFLLGSVAAGGFGAAALMATNAFARDKSFEVTHTDSEWRQILLSDAYMVMRHEVTEMPGSSPLDEEDRKGVYNCAGCGLPLFSSGAKYHAGTGWPSFWKPLNKAVETRIDRSIGMESVEVHCRRCGGHLGHVFKDGPRPTGLRYCINGLSLNFAPA